MKRICLFGVALVLLSAAPMVAHAGPGRHTTTLYAGQTIEVGHVDIWNSGSSEPKFNVQIRMEGDWWLSEVQIFVGQDPIPATGDGNPKLGHFPFKEEFSSPKQTHTLNLDLQSEFGFSWGQDDRFFTVAVHADVQRIDASGQTVQQEGAWAFGTPFEGSAWGWWLSYLVAHPMRGQFIDSPVLGLSYVSPTHSGVTGEDGGFQFFPREQIEFGIGAVSIGQTAAAKKVSPLDLWHGVPIDSYPVLGVARTLQSLDNDPSDGRIFIDPEVANCYSNTVYAQFGSYEVYWHDAAEVAHLLNTAVGYVDEFGVEHDGICDFLTEDNNGVSANLIAVSDYEAQGNLEAGLNASGIFRKNISKTEDQGESKQKLEVMSVYIPGARSNGDPSFCDLNANGIYDEGEDLLGVPYEEWRMNGDPAGAECDPRVDGEACVVTLLECRELAKPIIVAYTENIDIYDDQVTTAFWPGRFSNDIYAAVSRDDGTTWKRMNVSRTADLSSFDLETGEPFPGTAGSPQMKINDNYILTVWQSKFCRSGNPRYAINYCTDEDGDGTPDPCEICRETAEGTICEPDYPYDDPYFVTDIWGVRGQQQSVDYDEVDDVADLGIGEIPYSCLWAARGVIVTERELAAGTFSSLEVEDDPVTPEDETREVELGDLIWFKPERLTSGRRDAYIPVVGSARGAGFAIAWQEDPSGLRPGKGKGPGQGWSGAISNHKSDIWYSFIPYGDFATVDANFVPGGPGDDPNGEAQFDERPGLGRPKALVPMALPVRVSDNDMVNSHTLKVEASSQCVTPPGGSEQVCFPEVNAEGTFTPLNSDEVAQQFCDHPSADPTTCCDPDNHEGDPNCEDLKGLFGNLNGTKRYAYLARSIDDNGDGTPDYQYYVDRGGTLDLCDVSGENSYMEELPGTSAHERWYGFTNAEGSSKLVCVTSDGRLLDGDVSASRTNIQLQPYTKPDGGKSAWVLLAYEESKGMGHSLAASEHDNPVDETIAENGGQDKPIKQDLGKNVVYHSFDFAQPDLVAPGHIVNLPALCGGLYPDFCGEDYTGDNPTCTCDLGQPIPLYFDYEQCSDPTDPTTCEWVPDESVFLQYRTEIARRTRFIMQSPGKVGATKTLGVIIYKQGQEGQGRPADVFVRRLVKPGSGGGNPYAFENFECNRYLDETFDLPACPADGILGYNCNVWGEAYGDRLCGGVFTDPYGGFERRDHTNLTSADILLSVDAGPEDDTPDDPTDDVYGTDKVLLWEQHPHNLGQESYGVADDSVCTLASCAGMYSNARSHRGFVRGDFLVTAYALSPNWAAARNGRDRYNFYIRKSFDGGQTWTTTPASLGGVGIHSCPEWRSDPTAEDPDGTGSAPPVFEGFDSECVDWCASTDVDCEVTGDYIPAGAFQPAIKVSQFDNNKETSSDPRVGATPPVPPLDGTDPALPVLRFTEDHHVDNIFFVAWGGGDNLKSTGGTTVTPEAPPTDTWYTRSVDWGDHYFKLPWVIGGTNSNQGYGETVWRYDFLAKGDEEEQGECQLRATPDGSKLYGIWHQMVPGEEDPTVPITRWYPWEVEESHLNDLWFRRIIFHPDQVTQ